MWNHTSVLKDFDDILAFLNGILLTSCKSVANLRDFCKVIFLLRGWKTAKFTLRLWIYKQKLCRTKSCPTAIESTEPFGNFVPEGWTLHSVASKWPWRRNSIEFNLHCHITLTEVLNHFISLRLKLLCGINRISITAEIRLLCRETKHCWVNELAGAFCLTFCFFKHQIWYHKMKLYTCIFLNW